MNELSIHCQKLEALFNSANVQTQFPGILIAVSSGKSTITYPVSDHFFHGGNALHGAVYFKLLDDAAYFAAATFNTSHFIVTTKFEIRLLKPVHGGQLTATGTCTGPQGRVIKASSVLYDQNGIRVAEGEGTFLPSGQRWDGLSGYK